MERHFGDMKEILGRIDERVKVVVDSQVYITERFDKFIIAHSDLVERVARLEAMLIGNSKILEEVEEQCYSLKERISSIEVSQEEIEKCESFLRRLTKRVEELESLSKIQNFRIDSWSNRAVWLGETIFKCAWVLGMGWLLYKFGLGGVNFTP